MKAGFNLSSVCLTHGSENPTCMDDSMELISNFAVLNIQMRVANAAVDAMETTAGEPGSWRKGTICNVICEYQQICQINRYRRHSCMYVCIYMYVSMYSLRLLILLNVLSLINE